MDQTFFRVDSREVSELDPGDWSSPEHASVEFRTCIITWSAPVA